MTPTFSISFVVIPEGNLRLAFVSARALAVAFLFVIPEGNLRLAFVSAVALALAVAVALALAFALALALALAVAVAVAVAVAFTLLTIIPAGNPRLARTITYPRRALA